MPKWPRDLGTDTRTGTHTHTAFSIRLIERETPKHPPPTLFCRLFPLHCHFQPSPASPFSQFSAHGFAPHDTDRRAVGGRQPLHCRRSTGRAHPPLCLLLKWLYPLHPHVRPSLWIPTIWAATPLAFWSPSLVLLPPSLKGALKAQSGCISFLPSSALFVSTHPVSGFSHGL